MKKYEFTEETKIFLERTLHRIRAVRDFRDVKAGDLGGFLEKEENLAHSGNAWVSGNAKVSENALVYGDARVCGNALAIGNAQIGENALVSDNAWVSDNAKVSDNAWVSGNAFVGGNAQVGSNAWIGDGAWITVTSHYFVAGPIGEEDGYITFYKTQNGISVFCEWFSGDIEAFSGRVQEANLDNAHAKAYQLAIELAKLRIRPEGAV